MPLDLAGDVDRLGQALEHKAQLLLSAQERYFATIRVANAEWAVAAGARVGELYTSLRTALVEAPLPPGLGEEEARLYRSELRQQVRVLVEKALAAYEATLAAAQRAGVDSTFVPRVRESMEQLYRLLAEDDDRAAAAAPAPPGAPR